MRPLTAFLDTSMVVRYLTGIPRELAVKAAEVIDRTEGLQVSAVTVLEAAYVLTRVYRIPREHVVDLLMEFLRKGNIESYALDKSLALQGLLMCRPSGRISFGDAMIWAAARTQGSNVVYSLDERFPQDGIMVRSSGR